MPVAARTDRLPFSPVRLTVRPKSLLTRAPQVGRATGIPALAIGRPRRRRGAPSCSAVMAPGATLADWRVPARTTAANRTARDPLRANCQPRTSRPPSRARQAGRAMAIPASAIGRRRRRKAVPSCSATTAPGATPAGSRVRAPTTAACRAGRLRALLPQRRLPLLLRLQAAAFRTFRCSAGMGFPGALA